MKFLARRILLQILSGKNERREKTGEHFRSRTTTLYVLLARKSALNRAGGCSPSRMPQILGTPIPTMIREGNGSPFHSMLKPATQHLANSMRSLLREAECCRPHRAVAGPSHGLGWPS